MIYMVLAFSLVYFLYFHHVRTDDELATFGKTGGEMTLGQVLTLFHNTIYGYFYPEWLEQESVQPLFLISMFSIVIVMLNLLIAIISDSYNNAMQRSTKGEFFWTARMHLIMDSNTILENVRRHFPLKPVLSDHIRNLIIDTFSDDDEPGSMLSDTQAMIAAIKEKQAIKTTAIIDLLEELKIRMSALEQATIHGDAPKLAIVNK